MEIVSLDEARTSGLKKYYTGEPCKHGHISERYTSDRGCCVCRHLKNTTEKAKIYAKNHRELNSEDILEKKKIYYKLNKNTIIKYQKIYREENKLAITENRHDYYLQNKAVFIANAGVRRALKKKATVAWANKDEILKFYNQREKLSSETEIIYHVDHIVPLQSPLVCGLHNEFNLQILTAKENLSKCNRIWPDMPDDIEEALKFYYG
jgi:hypothetical protein